MLSPKEWDPGKAERGSEGRLEVVESMHVAQSSRMSSWPLCVSCGPHLEAITDVTQWELCKTQLEPVEEPGEGVLKGREGREGKGGRLSLLRWLVCGFPITRKLFGHNSGITRFPMKPRREMSMEDLR